MAKADIILGYLFTGVTSFIVFASSVSVFGESRDNGDLRGGVFYILREEGGDENEPLVYYYDLETETEREVGRLPLPLRSHTGLSVSSDAGKIVGCALIPFDKNEGPKVEVYALGRRISGEYELTEKQSYIVPVYPFRSVYDEWGNAIYLTCNDPLPLEEEDDGKFGLQDFKLKVTLAVIDLDEKTVTHYDITSEGDQTGVTSISERGIYVAKSKGLGFIKRGRFFSLINAEQISRYYSTATFPLISSDEEGFIAEGYKKPEEAFSLRYVSFAHPPHGDLGEVEFAIPKPEHGWGVFYQLTNTVSPYSSHCLFTKHFNDSKETEKSLYWELLALDTETWETESIFKKYGYNYALGNPPFVLGWVAPEKGSGSNKPSRYVYNNNFIYRPWSFGED
jgi:hypothetical protein